jgi:uncharacterized lipoprotein YbaY
MQMTAEIPNYKSYTLIHACMQFTADNVINASDTRETKAAIWANNTLSFITNETRQIQFTAENLIDACSSLWTRDPMALTF